MPTYAPTGRPGAPVLATSTVGLLAPTTGLAPITAVAAMPLRAPVQLKSQEQAALRQYHIFASLRPWWIGQQYLTPQERPVDLPATLTLLAALALGGSALVAFGVTSRERQRAGRTNRSLALAAGNATHSSPS
jgi:hypothetical protein